MTLTLHTAKQDGERRSNLYVFGEDFDAIMDILEEEEDLDGQFESLVSDVSMELQKYLLFQLHHSKILSYKLLMRTLMSLSCLSV